MVRPHSVVSSYSRAGEGLGTRLVSSTVAHVVSEPDLQEGSGSETSMHAMKNGEGQQCRVR